MTLIWLLRNCACGVQGVCVGVFVGGGCVAGGECPLCMTKVRLRVDGQALSVTLEGRESECWNTLWLNSGQILATFSVGLPKQGKQNKDFKCAHSLSPCLRQKKCD